MAPAATLKKFIPKARSNSSSISATVITGNASTSSIAVTIVIHVNSGILIRLMPGARMLTIVTMKLNDAASDAIPSTCNDTIHTSIPCPALNVIPVSGE